MLLLVRADQRAAEGADHQRRALAFQGSLTHPRTIVAVFLVAEGTLAEGMLAEGMLAEGMLAEGTLAEGTLAEGMPAARMADPMDLRMM
jgi:hypothetical protein